MRLAIRHCSLSVTQSSLRSVPYERWTSAMTHREREELMDRKDKTKESHSSSSSSPSEIGGESLHGNADSTSSLTSKS